MMGELRFGQIVLLKFPFTDGRTSKKRPALILRDSQDGDILVCRITSKLYDTLFDVKLKRWEVHGLRLPSVLRVHKIATLEKDIVDLKIVELDKPAQLKVKRIFKKLIV